MRDDTQDADPLYKAKIHVEVDGEVCEALCDTGCQRSCISEKFILKHPNLFNNQVKPFKGKTVSIDGSRVNTIGIINIAFRINGRFMRANCRIVRNLVFNFVLGWDFFSKYNCSIHPKEGYVSFENERINFIRNSLEASTTHFALDEDVVVPPFSKMISPATYYLNPEDRVATTDTVQVEPLAGNSARVAVGRTISKTVDGRFPVELLNPYPTPITIKAHEILGHVSFTTDAIVDCTAQATSTVLAYVQEPLPKKPAEHPNHKPPDPVPCSTKPSEAPDGAKQKPEKPNFNYSTVAKDAEPYLDKLKTLLEQKHANTFSKGDLDWGKTDLISYEANMRPGPPIAVPPYRATPQMQMEMDKIVHEMLANGLVSHSTSAFSAPVLLVPKKLGGWRFVTDFRKVNARCERVVYPLPRIEDSLRKLQQPRYFSTMDLTKGFWQVPIKEEDRKFFAFSTGTMHVEYNVMPMGALNSSSTMQALMSLILRGLPPEHVLCFLDDILVASSTMEEHLQHLDLVLSAIAKAGLKLNPKKCLFAQAEVTCLGHRLSRDGIGPDPANLEKIRKWKPPTNRTEVRQFLGLTGYYRHMIKDYAKIAAPLTDLTKRDVEWSWKDKEQLSFVTLRDHLTSSTIMSYPDFTIPFWVKSDASGGSVGFVLTQKPDKKEKVVAYGSKKLTPTQRRYSTYDREFFGIVTAIRTYSHYLRHAHFFVVTDHRPLLNLRKVDPKTDATGRRVRWSIELNLYDFDVIYKKGRKHGDADAMSRLDSHDDVAEEEEEDLAGLIEEEEVLAGFIDADEVETLAVFGFSEPETSSAFELVSSKEKRKELAEAQDADPTTKEIKELVRAQQSLPEEFRNSFYRKHYTELILVDDVLHLKSTRGSTGLTILQAIIPPQLINQVLSEAHGTILSGHPGCDRMAGILRRNVIWPGLYSDCRRFVATCPQCDQISEPNPPLRTELQSHQPQFVFEHVCCDLLQLPPSKGWKYVCVFMDMFSRHVSLYKLRDKSATSFARALEDYVAHVGCPQKLTCDNGSEFCNELVDAVVRILGTRKRTSVVYRPQSQGNVERMNRQLIQQLTARLLQFKNTWPENLHYVALAHNAAPASGTGESPNLVFFGRELPLPNFSDLSVNTLRHKSVREYVQEMKRRVQLVHDAVREESAKQRAKSAEYYNRKTKHVPLEPGEMVYYKQTPKNRTKIDPKWVGPVRVVRRHCSAQGTPGTTYTLEFGEGATITRNYEQLKRVKANIQSPALREELPGPRAPSIPCVINVDSDDSSSDEAPGPPAPVASRTRQRTKLAKASAAVPVAQDHTTPSLDIPTASTTQGADPVALVTPTHVTSAPAMPGSAESPPATPAVPQPLIAPPPPQPPTPPAASPPPGLAPSLASSAGALNLSLSWDHMGTPTGSGTPGSLRTSNNLLPPAVVAPLSSRSASPDFFHDTVVRVSPPVDLQSGALVWTAAVASTSIPTPTPALDHMAGVASSAPQPADAAGSKESSGVSHEFLERLDVLSEEIRLEREVGHRKIDILMYKGYEHRCDRKADRLKHVQLWRCRYAAKFKCRGGFKLDVVDLDDIESDSVVSCVKDHNHQPYTINSYGLANMSELIDTDVQPSDLEETEHSHAISRLDEGEFSRDFGPDGLEARIQSSPIRTARTDIYVITCAPPVDDLDDMEETQDAEAAPLNQAQLLATPSTFPPAMGLAASTDPDISTVLVDTSQFDARGYRVQAYRDPRRISQGSNASQPPQSPHQ